MMARKLECRKCGTFNRAGNVCMCSQSTATAGHRINLGRFLISDEDATKTMQDVHGEIVERAAMLVAEKNEKTMEQALIVKQQEAIAELTAENERLREAVEFHRQVMEKLGHRMTRGGKSATASAFFIDALSTVGKGEGNE